MSDNPELSKIYRGLNEEDEGKARLVVPRLMETLYKMDDEARSRGGDNAFTLEQVHKESKLGAISEETFTKIVKHCGMMDEPLLNYNTNGKVSLTDRGRAWYSRYKGG